MSRSRLSDAALHVAWIYSCQQINESKRTQNGRTSTYLKPAFLHIAVSRPLALQPKRRLSRGWSSCGSIDPRSSRDGESRECWIRTPESISLRTENDLPPHQHEGEGGDSWFFDAGRMQRLTFNTAQDNAMPVWSRDGARIRVRFQTEWQVGSVRQGRRRNRPGRD